MVVNAVVQHWVEDMVEIEGRQGRRGREGRNQNALFYADDGLITFSDLGFMQGVFNTLVGLFAWLGLRTNISNMVGMVCRPCQAAGTQSEALYKRRMTGAVLSYQERQQVIVQCL